MSTASSTRPRSSSSTRAASRGYAKPTASSRPTSRNQISDQNNGGEKRQIVGQYMLGKTIGEGTFGKVKLAAHMPTGEKVAVKILEKSRIKEAADVRRVNREIKILKKARHGNVIQLYEVLDTPHAIYLIMECAEGGEMFDYIVAQKRVPEAQACKFFHQIVDGVDELHKNEITHRDLKPENLLLKASPDGWIVKVVDFGLSNTHDGGRLLATACGSPCYAAPEMIAGKKYVGPLADIWSMGVILFALVCGYLPFEDSSTPALYKKILSCDYKAPKFISPEVRDLIARVLEVDPKKRYTMQDIRQHPWYTMIPEAQIPKESVDVYAADPTTREETLSALTQSGIDRQLLLDGLASHACNSLTATFYLYEQKQRAIRAKQLKQAPAETIQNNASDVSANTHRSAPETSSHAPAPANAPAPAAAVPPSGAPPHGVHRPVLPASSNTATVTAQHHHAVRTGAPLQGSHPIGHPPGITVQSAGTAPATSAATSAVPAAGVSSRTGNVPSLAFNAAPYLVTPSLLQAQPQAAVGRPSPNSSHGHHHHGHSTNNSNNNNNNNNMPSLDLYMKQQMAALPSIGQTAAAAAATSNNNNAQGAQSQGVRIGGNVRGQAVMVPPLQLAVGGTAAGVPAVAPAAAQAEQLVSQTARPSSNNKPAGGVAGVVHTARAHLSSQQQPQQQQRQPSAQSQSSQQQQQQLLEGASPTDEGGARPSTRRSRTRGSRGTQGQGNLEDEIQQQQQEMGPGMGPLDGVSEMEAQLQHKLQISTAANPDAQTSTQSPNTVTAPASAAAAVAASGAAKAPEQPSAPRGSSAQGGRRGRHLVSGSSGQTTTTTGAPASTEVAGAAAVAAASATVAAAGVAVTGGSGIAREEAARNKSVQQGSLKLSDRQ